MLQRLGILVEALLIFAAVADCTLSFSLVGYTNIPTDGSGRILITDIGFDNANGLICRTNTPNPTGGDYYLHPSMQTTNIGDRIVSLDTRGWSRNRDLSNGIIRLMRDSTSWTEGVFTCEFHGISDPSISVVVYYSSTLSFSLVGYTNIPTDGSGRILVSNIGFDDTNALICHTDTPNPPSGNYYLHPSMQTTNGSDRIQSTDTRGWSRNRDLSNGIIRLMRDSTSWTEGVFTCRFRSVSDPSISVGVYYSITASVSINMVSAREGTYTVTCTTTGGTVLSGSLTGPGGVNVINFSPVGTRNYRGQDSYRASTGTRTGGSDGDTYQCTATNGVPAPDGSGSTTLRVASPPTMVSAQQVAPGSSLSVTWMAPSGEASVTGYTVHYSIGGDTGSVNVGPSTTATTITGRINDGHAYIITVEAKSVHLSGESSATAVILRAPPSPPTGVHVANIQPHSVTLSWDAQSGVASYTVQYTQTQGASQLGECKNSIHSGSVSTTNASTSITVQGSGDDMLREFTTYSITVTAVSVHNFIGSSAPSAAMLVTTAQTGAAAPPSDVEVTVQSSKSIIVQWGPIEECRDRNGNIVRYHVRYQASGGSVETEVVSGVGSAGGQVLLEGLTPFTDYSIQVAAVNNQSDVGVFSAVISSKTFASPVVISAIPDFFQILLTWEPPEGPHNTITVYEVSHRLVAQPEKVTRENTTDLTRRLTVSGLEPGTEVTFTVRAYSRGGAGVDVTVTVSTLTHPPPVQGVSVTRLSASSVLVSWEPFMTESNVTGYTVIYSRVSRSSKRQDGEMRSVFPATATFGVIDGLESEAIYMFQVLASAVVGGEEVVGDRSLLTKDSLVFATDCGYDSSSDTCTALIIVSVIIALIAVGEGIIIAVMVYIKMRSMPGAYVSELNRNTEVRMVKMDNVVTTDVNQAYRASSVEDTGPEEASAYETVDTSVQSPDSKELNPIYEGIADD